MPVWRKVAEINGNRLDGLASEAIAPVARLLDLLSWPLRLGEAVDVKAQVSSLRLGSLDSGWTICSGGGLTLRKRRRMASSIDFCFSRAFYG
jgi:hypothetical protein